MAPGPGTERLAGCGAAGGRGWADALERFAVIGLVLVSHSQMLAEGLAALAAEMGGGKVRIVAAGGLGADPSALGTDAERVSAAISQAWAPGGVLVLADLGSALLSAEMAIEQLDEERRNLVVLSAAPLVEGAVAAAALGGAGAGLAEVEAEARAALLAKGDQLGAAQPAALPAHPAPPQPAPEGPPDAEVRLWVLDPLGLHARPAAEIVRSASAFEAKVSVTDLTSGRGPASARSLSALAALGAGAGHELVVQARGPRSQEALAALAASLSGAFGRNAPLSPPPARQSGEGPGQAGAEAGPDGSEVELAGVAVGRGVGIGPVVRLGAAGGSGYVPSGDPAREAQRLSAALGSVRAELQGAIASLSGSLGAADAAVVEAQLLLAEDEELVGEAARRIGGGEGAAGAWEGAVAAQLALWEAVPDPYLRSRAVDLRQLGERVSEALSGGAGATHKAPGAVLVAEEISVLDVARLAPGAAGVACAGGAPTSHAGILLAALGTPAVFGAGPRLMQAAEGSEALVDAERAVVVLRPAPRSRELAAERAKAAASRRALAAVRADRPAATAEGMEIPVLANAASAQEVQAAIAQGADGIGLFRTEILFAAGLVDARSQAKALSEAVAQAGGRPFVLRILDVGSDKPLGGRPAVPEANPALGLRGLRWLFAHPSEMAEHLRAVAEVASRHRVSVMAPMVSIPSELRLLRDALAQAAAPGAAPVILGAMVEVPSAALCAAQLLAVADFLSIGTNDLAQYVMAADRTSAALASLGDALHPAVLRLIAEVAAAAAAAGRPLGLCGALAGDPAATELLLGLGVGSLSVPAAAVGEVKEAVRATRRGRAAELAEAALGAEDAGEVRRILAGHGATVQGLPPTVK